MNRIFEPEVDFNSLEVFIVIFVLLLFRHIVFEFTVHTCMPNARRSGPVVATKERKLGPPAAACYILIVSISSKVFISINIAFVMGDLKLLDE